MEASLAAGLGGDQLEGRPLARREVLVRFRCLDGYAVLWPVHPRHSAGLVWIRNEPRLDLYRGPCQLEQSLTTSDQVLGPLPEETLAGANVQTNAVGRDPDCDFVGLSCVAPVGRELGRRLVLRSLGNFGSDGF